MPNPNPLSIPRRRPAIWAAAVLLPALLPVMPLAQANPSPWALQPDQVQPGKSFDFKLLNSKYSGCEVFDKQDVVVEAGRIEVAFRTTKPEVACGRPAGPTGPSFQAAALAAGTYPVSYREFPACYPDCHAAAPLTGPVDTLVVSASPTPIRLSGRRIGSPQAEVVLLDQGIRLTVSDISMEPDRLILSALSGKTLRSFPIEGRAGAPMTFGVRLEPGAYLVRLSRAGREIHARKIVKY
jgi:hypothetical protein